jgi:hypothetical protein
MLGARFGDGGYRPGWDRRELQRNVSRRWRNAMPLYRRLEPNVQVIEFQCIEFVEECLYGHVRRTPLVKH